MGGEAGSWAQYQKLVLKLLEQHDEKLEELFKQLKEADSDRATIHVSLASLKEDTELLMSLIRDHEKSSGHGQTIMRLEKLELKVQELSNAETLRTEESKEVQKYKRGMFTAVAGTIIAVGWDLIQHFFFK